MEKYKTKKVLTIGSVVELTELSERQIRYYEERKLIEPARTDGGTRKYSFEDVEKLVNISKQINDGISTYEIRQKERKLDQRTFRELIRTQINAQFNIKDNKPLR